MSTTKSVTAGTLDFCRTCPVGNNCCSRARHGGSVEAPVLLRSEASVVAGHLDQSVEDFSRNLGDGIFRQIRSEDGCTFFVGGRCQIYADRPIDCRLFPVDILEQDDGTLIWIVYTRLCPSGLDREGLLDHAERLLPALAGHARAYARVEALGMDAEPYEIIGKLTAQ